MNTTWNPYSQSTPWTNSDTFAKQPAKMSPQMPQGISNNQDLANLAFAMGNIPYAALPTWPATSHRLPHEKNQPAPVELPLKTKLARIIAPILELITAGTFLLNIPTLQRWTEQFQQSGSRHLPSGLKHVIPFAEKSAPEFSAIIKRLGNPRVSNLLLVSTILFRTLFNTSIGTNQQQASMVMTNIGAVLLNLPLMLMMELATKKGGTKSAIRYSKILSLVNLSLAGLYATGFVQKARHDAGKQHYNHDMRNFNELFDFKNRLNPSERIQRGIHELKSLVADSGKSYRYAWNELRDAIGSPDNFKTTINPLKPEGAPGRIAFSAFTMPLGALIALMNIRNNKKIAFTAAFISIFGNLANGIALSLTAWLDKDQPFRWLGVLGGLASPIAEGVLTSKSPIGPAAMTTSNAFQNMYQATAWAHPNESQQDNGNGNKKVYLNKNQLLPPP